MDSAELVGGNLELVKFLLQFSLEQKLCSLYIDPRENSNMPLLSACRSKGSLRNCEIFTFIRQRQKQ